MDGVDQGIDPVFVREAGRVPNLVRAAPNVFDKGCPVKRAAEVVGDRRTSSINLQTASGASCVHSAMFVDRGDDSKRGSAVLNGLLLDPRAKDVDHFAKVERTACRLERGAFDPRHVPVVIGTMNLDAIERSRFEFGASQFDAEPPARVVQSVDRDSTIVFPVAVAVGRVPALKPNERAGLHAFGRPCGRL